MFYDGDGGYLQKPLKYVLFFNLDPPNNLSFLLHIMIVSNLICPTLLWKYMEIISTLFYFGLYCSIHLTFTLILCSSVLNCVCMSVRL